MLMDLEARAGLHDLVRELQGRAGITNPPVDALTIARVLGITMSVDRGQSGRGRLKRIAGRPAMFLRPEPRPERLQWTVAHEIGESQMGELCHRLGWSADQLVPRQREELANRFAQELLLPLNWFAQDAERVEFDLTSLKLRYATASHELIAWRFLDLERPGIVSIYDQKVLTRRRANFSGASAELSRGELTSLQRMRNYREALRRVEPSFTIRGWCIDIPGWLREIMYVQYATEEMW